MRNKKRLRGFTLIELMVVIVIIGILVAIALPNFIASQKRAKIAEVKSNAKTLQIAIETYSIDYGLYPDRLSSITSHSSYKEFKNPFTGFKGVANTSGRGAWRTSYYGAIGSPGDLLNNYNDDWATKGLVMYVGMNQNGEATTSLMSADGNVSVTPSQTTNYMIFACSDDGETLKRFVLSPSELTPKAKALSTAGN